MNSGIAILLALLLSCSLPCAGQNDPDTIQTTGDIPFINPTGTYHCGPYTPEGAGEPIGNQGEIRIQYLGNNRIAICLNYVSHGPGFHMGYIFDTLYYADNWAEWHSEFDTTCTVRFAISEKGINVRQHSEVPGWACDFGHNVYVDGYYRKESESAPVIEEDCN